MHWLPQMKIPPAADRDHDHMLCHVWDSLPTLSSPEPTPVFESLIFFSTTNVLIDKMSILIKEGEREDFPDFVR